jgi:hypothetical protein
MERIGAMKKILLSIVLSLIVVSYNVKVSDAANLFQNDSAGVMGSDMVALQDQMARFEAERFGQIKNALLTDFWTQYRTYITALANGTVPDPATTSLIYPKWPLSGAGTNPKANFTSLANKYLPDLISQLNSLFTTTGTAWDDFYEIAYVPAPATDPKPAPGHVVIRRKNVEISTQQRIRGLVGSISVENAGTVNGVITMRVDPPSAFMGSDALNIALVRNNGLTLDRSFSHNYT